MIDNKELIKPLLTFEKEGDFYALYIMKRKKDQLEGEKQNHQSVRTIKVYYIDSLEYLEKRWDEIVHLCEYFKARAYIHVCRQNHKDVGMEMMVQLATSLKNGVTKFTNLFDSVVGQIKVSGEKRWIVDVDTKDELSVGFIARFIEDCRPIVQGYKKIILRVPTKNGWHFITRPFDVSELKFYLDAAKVAMPDIQKKNPTLLYLPESLE